MFNKKIKTQVNCVLLKEKSNNLKHIELLFFETL